MLSSTRLRRSASVLSVGAIVAAGALGAGLVSPASADEGGSGGDTSTSVKYRCTGAFGPVTISVDADLSGLADGDPTGMTLPDGLGLDVQFGLPDDLVGGIFGFLTSIVGQLDGFGLGFGGDLLPTDGSTDPIDPSDPVVDTGLSTAPFTLPDPGSYDVTLPDEFSFSTLSAFGIDLFSIDCTRVGDGVVETVQVDEQTSTVVAKSAGTHAKPVVLAGVRRELGGRGAGKVTASVKGRTVARGTLRNGVARMALPRSAAGQRVVVHYLGNKTTKPSTKSVATR